MFLALFFLLLPLLYIGCSSTPVLPPREFSPDGLEQYTVLKHIISSTVPHTNNSPKFGEMRQGTTTGPPAGPPALLGYNLDQCHSDGGCAAELVCMSPLMPQFFCPFFNECVCVTADVETCDENCKGCANYPRETCVYAEIDMRR